MTENEGPMPAKLKTEEQAYAWVVRLASDQCTRRDEARFQEWLGEDEDNPARFEQGQALWDELGALRNSSDARAALGHLYDASPLQDLGPPPLISRRAMIGGGLSALAAATAGVLILPKILTTDTVYATAKGEQRRIALNDGSTVMLDTATRIAVDIGGTERRIRLEYGQAFFDVAPDPGRPFRVFVGADEVRALGTSFEVRFEGAAARVILEEGKVAVFRDGALKAIERSGNGLAIDRGHNAEIILKPGQSANLSQAAPIKVAEVDLSKTNAWRDGEMVFDDVALRDAVAEVNRYGGRQIVLDDPALAELRISGTFHTNRPETFVEGVTAALPVRLQQANSAKLILKKM